MQLIKKEEASGVQKKERDNNQGQLLGDKDPKNPTHNTNL